MENFSYHVPVYVVTGVATSGHSSDLVGGTVGLFDRNTFSVATNVGNGTEFFFAQGNTGGKSWYGQSVTESHKSPFFYGADVEDIYVSYPQRIKNEEWVIGYNGGPSSKGLSFTTGKPIRVKLYFHGQPIYRFFGGPKEYVVSYTPPEDCTTPCTEPDCPDAIGDCLTHTQALVNAINTHVELQKFGVRAQIVTSTYGATSTNMTKYCLDVCDNGDAVALSLVQAQAPAGVTVTRTARNGSTSTYQFCQPDGDDAPADFQQTGDVLLAVCDTCPSGSFEIPAKDVFIVRRPIVGGEDFSTAASRDTYANTVWTAYANQDSITTTTSTTSTTTASGTLTNSDANFIGQDNGVAIVELKFNSADASTAADAPIGSDSVQLVRTEPAVCVFNDPAAIAWTSCGTGIQGSRSLIIRALQRPDCDADGDRLDDLTTILSGVDGIDVDSLAKVAGDGCADDYTVTQYSQDCLSEEDCQANQVTFTYAFVPAVDNKQWEEVPAAVEEDDARKCGIRISAGYIDPKFGNCSFVPTDYYETMPLKMEVSLLGETDSACDDANWPSVQQVQVGQISRQSGEWVVRELLMKTAAYLQHVSQFSLDSREREAFDMRLLDTVDRTAFYKVYYIRYRASYGKSWRKNEQEKFTSVFAFKEGDKSALEFESNVVDVLTLKSGVAMHVNN